MKTSLNHVFRTIWSEALNTWIAVSELTPSKGKAGSSSLSAAELALSPALSRERERGSSRLRLNPLVIALACCFSLGAEANPIGAQIANGTVAINQVGSTLTVTNSPGAIINWQGFSINAGETTRFVQQSASSSVLNRVVGPDPSTLLGTLTSNGRVFLINPAGIMVGQGAVINVPAFVASTLNLSNADFLANKLNFGPTLNAGAIRNDGSITMPDGGTVYLVAPQVTNNGIITTPKGETILAAGETVTLVNTSTPGVTVEITGSNNTATNLGQVIADTGRIGTVGAMVRNSGTLNASSMVSQGGKIFLRATRSIDAGGTISARGVGGGEITVLADMLTGAVNVTGKLDASAPHGGNGGFIETSAARVSVVSDAIITTAAPHGKTGTWLIDPTDYTIATSGGDITGATLGTNLGTSNVTILSSSGAGGTSGNVNVNDTVSWSLNKLTLNAQNNININAAMNASGTASLALEYGQGAVAAGNTADYVLAAGIKVSLPAGNNFSTKLGSDGATNIYTVITSLGAAGSVTTTDLQGMSGGLSGMYALGADINATATSGWNAGAGFLPIGNVGSLATSFTGKFDGLGHTITSLTINRSGTGYAGLFGYAGYVAFPSNAITSASIRNVGLVGGSVVGSFDVGGLVGYLSNSSTITNSYNTGTVSSGAGTGNLNVGGLVGYDGGGTITNSYSTGNVSSSAGNQVGGLVGSLAGTLTNSYSTGTVSGFNSVGGLVGSTSAVAVIARTYSTGNVTGNNGVGGLAGYNYNTITNSYSTGTINGNIYVGGLVGYNSSAITNSYSTGAVTGANQVGGLVGNNLGNTISNSFWDTTTSGLATGVGAGFTAGATGMLTANMKTSANFTSATVANGNVNPNWDFAATWVMTDGQTYPVLRAFMIPLTVTASAVTKTYDGIAYSGGNGVTYSGFAAGDTSAVLSGLLAYGGTSQSAVNVGSYSIVPSGYSSIKYTITYVNGMLTISPAQLTVTASNANKIYDGLAYSGGNGVTYTGFVNGETSAVLGGTLVYGGTSQGATNAGSYLITPSGLTSGNYAISYTNGVLTVASAALVPITAPAANQTTSVQAAIQQVESTIIATVTASANTSGSPNVSAIDPNAVAGGMGATSGTVDNTTLGTLSSFRGTIGGVPGTFAGMDSGAITSATTDNAQPANGNSGEVGADGSAKKDTKNDKNNGKSTPNAKPERC